MGVFPGDLHQSPGFHDIYSLSPFKYNQFNCFLSNYLYLSLLHDSMFGSLLHDSMFGSLLHDSMFGSLLHDSMFGSLLHDSMFGSLYLQLFVGDCMSYFMLFVFACVWCSPTNTVFFVVWCTLCCQPLWTIHC